MRRILSTDQAARRPASADSGFTLIELVIVMVLVGILGAVVAMFGSPIRAGVEGQLRAELADAADTAYRRMARDLRLALPNSIKVSGDVLTMIPTKDGGRYDDSSFIDDTSVFDIDGAATAPVEVAVDDYVVVGNWGATTDYAYCAGASCKNRAKVSAVTGSPVTRVTLAAAIPATYATPGNRFQVVNKDEQVVSYDCSGGNLTRRWGNGFEGATQSAALLAKNIQCSFSYVQYDADLWGLIYMKLTMQHTDLPGDTPVELVYQLHVDNTP